MTVVGLNPSAAPPLPRRRTLLPRNPTPWTSPEIPTLPPQVQRLLQQIGGPSYQTYQPFQVVQPLITPQPTVSFKKSTASSVSSKKSSISTALDLGNGCTPNLGLSQVSFPFSTSALNHSTSNRPSVVSNPVQGARLSPLPLTQLCRNRLVSHFGLRKLRRILLSMQAPKCVAKFLSTLSAKECVVRSSAPLLDVFEKPFFHRAVTWQVECSIDGEPYLATYAHTDTSALVQCEWASHVEQEDLDERSSAWLYSEHPHVMGVWGVVVDPHTGNNFYLLDTPIATLDQVLTRLHELQVRLPEPQVWGLVGCVASALLYASRGGLPYALLQLNNVFLLPNAVVVENALTRKRQLSECSCSSRGCCAESCIVQNVGRIVYALCTCGTRSHHVHVGSTRALNGAVMRDLRRRYSRVLLSLLARTLGVGDRASLSSQSEDSPNRRRVFADVNKPASSPCVRKIPDDSTSDLSHRKSMDYIQCGNNFHSTSDFHNASYPSLNPSFYFPSNSSTSSSSLSSVSSVSFPFHSSPSNSSSFLVRDTNAFISGLPDVCVAVNNASQSPEQDKAHSERSSSNLSEEVAKTAHATIELAMEPTLFNPAFLTTSHSSAGSDKNSDNSSKKLDHRPSHRDPSTRPKSELYNLQHPQEKRRKRTHQRRRHASSCNTSKENVSPETFGRERHARISNKTEESKLTTSNDIRICATELEAEFPTSFAKSCHAKTAEDASGKDSLLYSTSHIHDSSSSHTRVTLTNSSFTDFQSISLEEIVFLAEAEVKRTCCDAGCTLEETLQRLPRDLVELATCQSS